MSYYVMYAETCNEDYAAIDKLDPTVRMGASLSAWQLLDREPCEAQISDDSGLTFPDFLQATGGVALISDKFRQVLDKEGVDSVFYKRMYLTCAELGKREPYWLMVPQRIQCLDLDSMAAAGKVEREEIEGLAPWEVIIEVQPQDMRIVPSSVGRYKIFKCAQVCNQEIIVSEELKAMLEKANLENVYFDAIKEE